MTSAFIKFSFNYIKLLQNNKLCSEIEQLNENFNILQNEKTRFEQDASGYQQQQLTKVATHDLTQIVSF